MTEQVRLAPAIAHLPTPPRPGYLLTPLGWAAQPLATIIAAEPGLLPHLFELDRRRIHLIALAFAHLDTRSLSEFGPVLIRASVREVLQHVLGRSPVGVEGALRRLPHTVLSQQSYRHLVELLDDPEIARVLRHHAKTAITDATIELLYQVPSPLRPIVVAVLGIVHRLDNPWRR